MHPVGVLLEDVARKKEGRGGMSLTCGAWLAVRGREKGEGGRRGAGWAECCCCSAGLAIGPREKSGPRGGRNGEPVGPELERGKRFFLFFSISLSFIPKPFSKPF